jgi:hypothetical protein
MIYPVLLKFYDRPFDSLLFEIKTAEKGGKLTLEQRNKQMLDYVTKRFNETRG